MIRRKLTICLVLFTLMGCSTQRIIVNQMQPILNNTVNAFFEESDLQIAEQALASNLKLVEGLLKSDPQNKQLLLILAQGYAGYALAFVEDNDARRAAQLYLRARDFALRLAKAQNTAFAELINTPASDLPQKLSQAKKNDVPALFWAGFSWSSYINLSLEDPQAIMDLAKVEAIMKRIMELDSSYFYGASYLFFGSLYGQKPPLLGGDPEKARTYFEKNIQLTQGKFLLSYVYAARFYAAKTLNEQLFDTYLQKVLDSPENLLPEMRLLNQVAKQKARHLLNQKEELF